MHNLTHPIALAHRGRAALPWTILALAVLTTACNATSAEVPAATVTPTATPIAIVGVSGSTTEDIGDDAGDSAQPDQAEVTTLGGSAACLPGTWSVDRASLASHIKEAMNVSSAAVSIEIDSGQGELLLTFDTEGGTTYHVQDLEFDVSIGGLVDIRVVIQGEGSGVGGSSTKTSAVLVLTPDQLFLQGISANLTLTITGVPSDANLTSYACSGDVLTLNPGDPRSTTWLRQP